MKIRNLINLLNHYTKSYDEGHPEISDREYDDLYNQLLELEEKTGIIYPNSPTQRINYSVVTSLNKVTHNHPMLSLAKTKSIDDVRKFAKGKTIIGMAKMDGLTCSLHYKDGILIGAETRGNGEIGEDILHNARVVPTIPTTIPQKDEIVIDGEIICRWNDFELFSKDYANPRNFAAGSIRLLDASDCARRALTFVAWDLITGSEALTLSEKLSQLEDLGFTVVPWEVSPGAMSENTEQLETLIEDLKEIAQSYHYPIDGLVFKIDNCAKYAQEGMTSHHPNGALAFKFYDEEFETTLRNIEYTMGKTSVLTPVAVFDEVDDGVSKITRASLHNLSVMFDALGIIPFVGQKITVAKMNQIIPQIVGAQVNNEPKEEMLSPPIICPYCGSPTKFVLSDNKVSQLVCANPNCQGLLINRIDHFCGRKGLDIRGLSAMTIEKLYDWGWLNKIEDLFTLEQHKIEWLRKPGFGVKSVENALHAIETAKDCELSAFISALGIPLIGSTYAKQIAKNCLTWENFCDKINMKFDFTSWDGFGEEMRASLLNFDYEEAKRIAEILRFKEVPKEESNSLSGLNFVITGSLREYPNRDALKQIIEQNGGKIVSSVSRNTSYLINNDATSNSTKNMRAQELGIPIITEKEFQKKFF